jgi:BirA family biotin operon repressor/biotin-[acetyl-CoA-carboxylase] ligase
MGQRQRRRHLPPDKAAVPSRTGAIKLPFEIHERDKVASTNDVARKLAGEGAPGLSAVWAKTQSSGRGRRGRAWSSPAGNLYVSLLLRPECPISSAVQLSLVAALGLGDALTEFVDTSRVQNKWPNDVQLDGKKVAGLLLESSGVNAEAVEWVIVGCGVNVAVHPNIPDYPTTSLNEIAEQNVDVEAMLDAFLRCFETRYDVWRENGVAGIRDCWLERAVGLGQEITVRLPTKEIRGVFEGLDASGGLILARTDGARELITAGEIFAEQ